MPGTPVKMSCLAQKLLLSRKIVSESKFYFGSKLLNKRATFCPKSRAWQKLNNESMRSRKKCVTLYLLFFFGKENVELGNLQGATNSGLGKHKRPPSKPIIRLSIAASSNSYSPPCLPHLQMEMYDTYQKSRRENLISEAFDDNTYPSCHNQGRQPF